MFDSSVTRGQKATFPLNGVIAGWTGVAGTRIVCQLPTPRVPVTVAAAFYDATRALL